MDKITPANNITCTCVLNVVCRPGSVNSKRSLLYLPPMKKRRRKNIGLGQDNSGLRRRERKEEAEEEAKQNLHNNSRLF